MAISCGNVRHVSIAVAILIAKAAGEVQNGEKRFAVNKVPIRIKKRVSVALVSTVTINIVSPTINAPPSGDNNGSRVRARIFSIIVSRRNSGSIPLGHQDAVALRKAFAAENMSAIRICRGL